MVDEELGVLLTLKQKQQLLQGLKEAKDAVKGVGKSTKDAGTEADRAAPKVGILSKKIDGIASASKRSGRVAGAMFGVLVSNSQGALGPIQDVQNKLMGVGSALDDTKNKAAKWTIGIGAALTGAGAVLGTFVSKEETSRKQLESAINGAGGNAEDYRKQIEKNIKTGEHYGNTAARTMSALNRLVLSTHNPATAFRLFNSVLQISAARHLDIEKVSLMVGRAMHGQARSLQAFGFNLSSTTKLQTKYTTAQKQHLSAIEAVRKAQQGLHDTQARIKDSQSKGGPNTLGIASAQTSVMAAQNALNKSVFNFGANSAEAALARARLAVAEGRYSSAVDKGNKSGGLSLSQQISLRNAHERLAAAQKKLHDSTLGVSTAQKDLAKNGDVANQIIKQTGKYMSGQADAAANTFTGHMNALAAVIDDKLSSAGSHFYKWLIMLGPALMGVGAIMETGIIGKSFRGTKMLLGFADAEGKVRLWSIRNMVTQTANGVKIAAVWLLQTVRILAFKVAMFAVSAATKAYTAVQWLLNAAMSANPLVIVIGLLVAMAVAFVVLYNRSETFRRIVNGALHAVLAAIQFVWGWVKKNWPYLLGMLGGPFGLAVVFILRHWKQVKTFFKNLPGELKSIMMDVGKIIVFPFVWAFDEIAKFWNKTVGKIGFHVPGWIPGLGGKGWSIPDIPIIPLPALHEGGIITGGGVVNMKPGEEIVYLPTGATVVPLRGAASTLDKIGGAAGGAASILDKIGIRAGIPLQAPPPQEGVSAKPGTEIVYLPTETAVAPLNGMANQPTDGSGSEATHIVQLVVDGKVLAEVVHQSTRDQAARQ
jgi:hypothetical protein